MTLKKYHINLLHEWEKNIIYSSEPNLRNMNLKLQLKISFFFSFFNNNQQLALCYNSNVQQQESHNFISQSRHFPLNFICFFFFFGELKEQKNLQYFFQYLHSMSCEPMTSPSTPHLAEVPLEPKLIGLKAYNIQRNAHINNTSDYSQRELKLKILF